MAAEGQVVLQVEGEILRSNQRLLPLLQEGHLKNHRDGRIHLQGKEVFFISLLLLLILVALLRCALPKMDTYTIKLLVQGVG